MKSKKAWKEISEQIRKNDLDIGRERFSKMLDVSSNTVLRWEKAKTIPRPTQRAKLALLFRYLHPGQLATDPEDKEEGKMSALAIELVVRVLESGAQLLSRGIAAILLERLKAILAKREEKSPHRHLDIGEPEGEVSPIWRVLRRYADDEKFEEINEIGSALIEEKAHLHWSSLERARFLDWVGVGALRGGEPERAKALFEAALDGTDDPRIRESAYSNMALACLRLNRLELGKKVAEKALEINPEYEAAIYNRLCIASAEKQKEDCVTYAKLLRSNNQEAADDPTAYLGGALLNDPDLEFIRSLCSGSVFKELFPGLFDQENLLASSPAQYTGRKVRALAPGLSWVLLLIVVFAVVALLVAPDLADAGMTTTRAVLEKIGG